MKKGILFFTLIFFLIMKNGYSQDENFLGLSFGMAIPQGTYAEKDFTNEQAGYANTGFLFAFDAAWFPEDYLGIAATFTYASNNPDKVLYREDLINSIKERYPTLTLPPNTEISYTMDVWKYLNLFIGPTVTIPAGNFNFDLRAVAGVSFAWPPSQSLSIQYPTGENFSHTVQNKATPTLGYSAGGGIRYAIKHGYVIRVTCEYCNLKPELEIQEVLLDDTGQGDIETRKIDMPIKNIQLGIGIAYNFDL